MAQLVAKRKNPKVPSALNVKSRQPLSRRMRLPQKVPPARARTILQRTPLGRKAAPSKGVVGNISQMGGVFKKYASGGVAFWLGKPAKAKRLRRK